MVEMAGHVGAAEIGMGGRAEGADAFAQPQRPNTLPAAFDGDLVGADDTPRGGGMTGIPERRLDACRRDQSRVGQRLGPIAGLAQVDDQAIAQVVGGDREQIPFRSRHDAAPRQGPERPALNYSVYVVYNFIYFNINVKYIYIT